MRGLRENARTRRLIEESKHTMLDGYLSSKEQTSRGKERKKTMELRSPAGEAFAGKALGRSVKTVHNHSHCCTSHSELWEGKDGLGYAHTRDTGTQPTVRHGRGRMVPASWSAQFPFGIFFLNFFSFSNFQQYTAIMKTTM